MEPSIKETERDEIMLTVSVRDLVDAIREADIYKLPDMNEGTEYLYSNLYKRLSKGEEVTLSSLDFDAFEPEDIDSINSLHSDLFERNSYTAGGIVSALRNVDPVQKAVGYV